MNCKNCKDKLRVTHTYSTGGGRIRRLVCQGCKMIYVSQEVFNEAVRGNGAFAMAQKLRGEDAGPEVPGLGAEGEAGEDIDRVDLTPVPRPKKRARRRKLRVGALKGKGRIKGRVEK